MAPKTSDGEAAHADAAACFHTGANAWQCPHQPVVAVGGWREESGLRRTGEEFQGEDRIRPRPEEGEVAHRDDVRVARVERGHWRRHEPDPGPGPAHHAARCSLMPKGRAGH
eukprot:scaffold3893_cov112-Isochrysis_galbana.AAC.1